MLKGLATYVLNTYLGQYLEDLHADQLSIGLLNGNVLLENVPLRKDALRHLELPFTIKSGFIGKITLQIPVTRIRSEPWIVAIEQLYIVAGYIDFSEYDLEKEERAKQKHKRDELFRLEAAWRTKIQTLTGGTAPEKPDYSWSNYGTSIITEVIQNIQLKIKDVHIRFEDDLSSAGRNIAYGLTIDSLTVQTSDENWVPKFITSSSTDFSYKVLELKKLSVYLDPNATLLSSKSIEALLDLLNAPASNKRHQYILEPISCISCLKKNQSSRPLKSRSSPRFVCDVKFDTLPLVLTDTQYESCIATLQQYDRLEVSRPYQRWRPPENIMANPRAWWVYAVTCQLEKLRFHKAGRTWPEVLKRSKDIVRYAAIYRRVLMDAEDSQEEEDASFMNEVEKELRLSELKFIRGICMEDVAKKKKDSMLLPIAFPFTSDSKSTVVSSPKDSASKGILQSWFPAWSGWYSKKSPEEAPQEALPETQLEASRDNPANSLEEEFLDVISDSLENNTLMRRDAVFCQLSFILKQGSATVSQALTEDSVEKPMFKLEFGDVKMDLESRPRHEAFKVAVQLGEISVRDQVTPNTVFPLLISQQRENELLSQKVGLSRSSSSSVYAKLSSMISSVSKTHPTPNNSAQAPTIPLFSMEYEKNPRSSKIDNRLIIYSQSLDIIYNKHAFDQLVKFFTAKSTEEDESDVQLSITEAARKRYEKIKQQTKEELMKNWDKMVQGFVETERKRWDVQLNISAPQFIFPERYDDANATLVVVDLGKLVFCTANTKNQSKSSMDQETNSDDDTFATPCSTPDDMSYQDEKEPPLPVSEELTSDANLHDHLYDKYDLRLCDIQVLVAKVRDNWRFACQKGTGTAHVVDRFNINLHFERRVLSVLPEYTSNTDYQWPQATLSGSLPNLGFHINEHKVQSLKTLVLSLLPSSSPSQPKKSNGNSQVSSLTSKLPRSDTLTSFTVGDETMDRDHDSQLFIMQFGVDKLSVELQSRGRFIAELQVTGVRAQVSKQPQEVAALLSVHSLLLVDALQKFGPDFDLLIASHKHITMDSVSGSLLDSEPCSPTSPASPDPQQPQKSTSPVALSQALSNIRARASSPVDRHNARSPVMVSPTFGPFLSSLDGRDSEALISVEVRYITSDPDSSENDSHLISSVQFNSLDVIANQETVVELVGFFQQIFSSLSSVNPQGDMKSNDTADSSKTNLPSVDSKGSLGSQGSLNQSETGLEKPNLRVEVTFDFHKLTVLLLRGALKDKDLVGRKVATAVVSDAKIQMSVDSDLLTIDGSLGGFQIRDLNPEGNKHQCIISMGHDPIVERSKAMASQFHTGIYQPMTDITNRFNEAFRFKIIRPLVLNGQSSEEPLPEGASSREQLTIDLRIASVCYTHSPQFLFEIRSCATEFKEYMAKVAASIKQAATEMAIGLVSKRIEKFASLGNRDASLRQNRQMSFSKSTDTLHFPQPPPVSAFVSHPLSPSHTVPPDLIFSVKLDVVLETPIIVLPEAPNSVNVLVAHLGQITLTNANRAINDGLSEAAFETHPNRTAEFKICVKDMSLHSLNIDDKMKDVSFSPLTTTVLCAEELYSCRDHGTPILHDTGIEIIVSQKRETTLQTEYESGLVFPSDIYMDPQPELSRDTFQIEGGVVTPLKVSMSRHQYNQLLRSLDNISIPSNRRTYSLTDIHKLDIIQEQDATDVSKTKSADNETRTTEPTSSLNLMKGRFTVPSLCVELQGDVDSKLKPLADLVLQDICATYEATAIHESCIEISLKSLTLEDLQMEEESSKLSFLMKSETLPEPVFSGRPESSRRVHHVPQFISSSCPEYSSKHRLPFEPSSLPNKIEMENPFHQFAKKQTKLQKRQSVSKYLGLPHISSAQISPSTPPPSPTPGQEPEKESRNSTLVSIVIRNIDEKHPGFHSAFDGNHRFVDVDFNSLVTVINIESWVMLLDFFRSMDTNSNEQSTENKEGSVDTEELDDLEMETLNTVMEIKVKNLTLVLNKADGELTRASINQVLVRSVGSDDNLTLTGRLGSLSLLDCTRYGTSYPQKFVTSGEDAMTFQLFKYSSDDPHLNRECDIRLKLKMSSIVYVHSQRFTMELIEFINQFFALRGFLSDWRLYSAGIKIMDRSHGTRLSLDISTESPIILIPMSNFSESVLVLNLGSLTVSNKFLFAGSEGTISEVDREPRVRPRSHSRSQRSRSQSMKRLHSIKEDQSGSQNIQTKCLLDVMMVTLANMDVIYAKRIPTFAQDPQDLIVWDFGTYAITRIGTSLLKDTFALRLQVERNLDSETVKIVPDFSVHGTMSKVHMTVDTNSYHLIKGLLQYNLGEEVPEPTVSPMLLKFQHKNKPAAKVQFSNQEVWTKLSIGIDLDNVVLEVDTLEGGKSCPLAKVDFIKSRLIFKSSSNLSKDIDLVSQEILICDTRSRNCSPEDRSNVFTNILAPAQDQSLKNDNPLQAEIHYRATKSISNFVVILNNMRLMGIMDWWLDTLSFIQSSVPAPEGGDKAVSGLPSPKICNSRQPLSQIDEIEGHFEPKLNPFVESTGLMTKQSLLADDLQVSGSDGLSRPLSHENRVHDNAGFVFKFNITASEVIVVENCSMMDSAALILKTTAVLNYRSEFMKNPVSCNLNPCELYSCILGSEEETALSIIDPVTVNLEIVNKTSNSELSNLGDLTADNNHVVEVTLNQLNIRLSYHDMKMFKAILESLPRQQAEARSKTVTKSDNASEKIPNNLIKETKSLLEMGFSLKDCVTALQNHKGNPDAAASWLLENASAKPVDPKEMELVEDNKNGLNIQALELRTGGSVNLCVIDDCGDCDAPLIELSLTELVLKQQMDMLGSAACKFSVDYYNRALSGWEPFIEPWKCKMEWNILKKHGSAVKVFQPTLVSECTMNITITSNLIKLVNMVSENWSKDFYKRDRMDSVVSSSSFQSSSSKHSASSNGHKRRVPFVPFAISNETGCTIQFTPITEEKKFDGNIRKRSDDWSIKLPKDNYTTLEPGQTTSFSFEERGKQRHGNTHNMKSHQLIVRVDKLPPVGPVTVDKVGVFFRQSHAVRIVFDISMDGVARKLIRVRSALLVTNKLPHPVELKLDQDSYQAENVVIRVPASETLPVPILHTWSRMHARPLNAGRDEKSDWDFGEPIAWQNVMTSKQNSAQIRSSHVIRTRRLEYRFVVYVRHDNYPDDVLRMASKAEDVSRLNSVEQLLTQPGHSIFLVSPLTLVNLLPFDLHYDINEGNEKARIEKGKEACISSVDPENELEMRLWIDSFNSVASLIIKHSTSSYNINLRLQDSHERILNLNVNVSSHYGKAIKVTVTAPYWLVNNTGLPLVFKQDGSSSNAAGQEDEHETARCPEPLLFSFSDQDSSPILLVRVGKNAHENTIPQFSKMIPLTTGTAAIRLYLNQKDQRPPLVYLIGVDVRSGKGRYRDTKMVTFSPRFYIENHSDMELMVSQKHFTSEKVQGNRQWLRALPGSWLPFHWPLHDMDPLMCVRMLVDGSPISHWSGGFEIDHTHSFNLNLQTLQGDSRYLQVEIISNDATFFIVFNDADSLPPPLRIDNFSYVPITFYQTQTQEQRLRRTVRPQSSVPYAWDEVNLPPHITCKTPGGRMITYNLNATGPCPTNLTYDNFIYIKFSATFRKERVLSLYSQQGKSFGAIRTDDSKYPQLVLSVTHGSRVTLAPKANGDRSQLWRMTKTQHIQHEGSSAPYDPTSKRPRNEDNILVLDLEQTPGPNAQCALMLRKKDPRRKLTQTWEFTADGRLKCGHTNLFVQARDGFPGLEQGNYAVLGPTNRNYDGEMYNNIPAEQAVSYEWLFDGSGKLDVHVNMDGPTRVLKITDHRDHKKKRTSSKDKHDFDMLSETSSDISTDSSCSSVDSSGVFQDLKVGITLKKGIGISLLSAPEELAYIQFWDINFLYERTPKNQTLDFSIRNIQVDNQLPENQCSVVLYVTPHSREDRRAALPALQVFVTHFTTPHTNAYTFEHALVNAKDLTVTIEESFLFKLLSLFGYDKPDSELEKEEQTHDTHHLVEAATSAHANRFYFKRLELGIQQVTLSVLTSKTLTPELKSIKRKMGLSLVQFENAHVSLRPFVREHPFETWNCLMEMFKLHYQMELSSQAIRILGSVDFLGNPIGLLTDVKEGVQELVRDGNVSGLIFNVAHGMANSTAKMTGSLSNVVSKATMDSEHEAKRQKLLNKQGSSSGHIVSGVKGLGIGLYGGLTSVVSQTYQGASREGVSGFFSGFAKGVIGTVAKPASGFLDLATGTASAVRVKSKDPLLKLPSKVRKRRLVVGANGLTPRFNENDAKGLEILRKVSKNPADTFVCYESLDPGKQLRMLISSSEVFFLSFKESKSNYSVALSVKFKDLIDCRAKRHNESSENAYIELVMKSDWENIQGEPEEATRRPTIHCRSFDVAHRASEQIRYARNVYDELKHTVTSIEDNSNANHK